MARKENLYKLISSLSKAEKRHFKISVSSSAGNSNYIKLFDAIDKQVIYDEVEIKKKFANEKFVKQLHVTKNYLAKLILKSLRNYHSFVSIEAELNIHVRNIEILYRRDLLDQCEAEIKRAENIADEYEKFSWLLQLMVWKRKVLMAMTSGVASSEVLDAILNKEKEAILKRERINEYWQLIARISDVFKGKLKWNVITHRKIFQNIKLANSLQARILFYHLHYTYNVTNGKSAEAGKVLTRLINYIEKYPYRIQDDPSSYITAMNNKIGHLLTDKDYKPVPALLNKIRSVPDKYGLKDSSSITVKLMLRYYNIELEMFRDLKRWDEGVSKISEVKTYLEKVNDSVPDMYRILFYYQFAYIYFRKNLYSEALKWTNEILYGKFTETREDILSYARFLNLIIHFEMKNIYVLRYAVESTRRFLKKKRTLLDYEKVLLKFFAKISTSLRENHKLLLLKLNNELFSSTDERKKNDILDYLDFDSWISEKLKDYK